MKNFSPLRLISGRGSVHEDLFLARYQQLLGHAIRLTRGNSDLANDLIQDAFLYFAETKPNLEEIENLDAYLYTALKHLHFAYLRRGIRDPIGELAVVDYESADLSLRAAPESNRLFVYDQISRICEYALGRRNGSRPNALLILRFFLGYYMEELSLLARSSKPTIRKALQAAQVEVQAALSHPTPKTTPGLRSLGPLPTAGRSEDFLMAIRTFILNASQESCLSRQELTAYYAGLTPSEIPVELLGHLAGCSKCLDRVNGLLGLPLLADRHPENIGEHSRKPKNGPGPGGAGGSGKFNLQRARRRSESIAHHEPRKLAIRIDGEERTAHDIASNNNHFVLKLSAREDPRVIEIVSEQDVCLLTFIVPTTEPGAPQEWRRTREFTDGRVLEAIFRYGENWPSVEVAYRDTTSATAALRLANPHGYAALATSRQDSRNWLRRLVAKASGLVAPNMNPLLASAVLFGLCSVLCFLLWTRSELRITAGTVLKRAEQSDVSRSEKAEAEVIYQKVRITGSGHAIERAIYRDPQKKRHLKQQHLSPDDQWLKEELKTAGVNWDEPLSASSYKEWHDHLPVKLDAVTRAGNDRITLTTSTEANGSVFKESLTVRESDFHPVGRTIELRGVGAVEIAELNYDVMPWGAVNQDWFEPHSPESLVTPEHAHPAALPHLPRLLTESELDETELSVRVALSQLNADTGEQILVSRSTDGVEIKGIVETNDRKAQLLTRLLQLPHAHPSLLSVEELSRQPELDSSSNDEPIQASSVEGHPSPLEQYLHEKHLPLDQLDTLSQTLFDQSVRIQQAEVRLLELHQRFREGNKLPADELRQLTELSAGYINTIEAALDTNTRALQSVQLDGLGQTSSFSESGATSENLEQQVHRYQELCNQLISNKTGEAISAAAVAAEIRNSGALIRSGANQIHTSVSIAHD
jgi:DNA-directed RNA polymerase specialized sigma24 family protein